MGNGKFVTACHQLLAARNLAPGRDEADKVPRKARSYVKVDDEIHHKITTGILQWCIPIEDGIQIL
jgi:hypothetical protein